MVDPLSAALLFAGCCVFAWAVPWSVSRSVDAAWHQRCPGQLAEMVEAFPLVPPEPADELSATPPTRTNVPPRRCDVRTLQPCGTHAAYVRHLRHGEVPCEACTKANRANPSTRAQRAALAALVGIYREQYRELYAAHRATNSTRGAAQVRARSELTYRYPEVYRALYLQAKAALLQYQDERAR